MTTTWEELFDRAVAYDVSVEDARAAVVAVREERAADREERDER